MLSSSIANLGMVPRAHFLSCIAPMMLVRCMLSAPPPHHFLFPWTRIRLSHSYPLISVRIPSLVAAVTLQCLDDLRFLPTEIGAIDYLGHLTYPAAVVGFTHKACTERCGRTVDASNWNDLYCGYRRRFFPGWLSSAAFPLVL